ncbi:MAG: hypothetical protein ACYTXY_49620, partial [Nostoc sp.]
GGSRPATSAESRSSVTSTPTTVNPLSTANVFVSPTPTGGASSNPLQPGITAITPATATTAGTVTYGLPSLYQFPKKLLTSLQAQVTNGNAKILTDPTLIVQEGQTAN